MERAIALLTLLSAKAFVSEECLDKDNVELPGNEFVQIGSRPSFRDQKYVWPNMPGVLRFGKDLIKTIQKQDSAPLEEYLESANGPFNPDCGVCKLRNNAVVLRNVAPAGLADRRAMFTIAGNLAGPLCAHVHVPSPAEILVGDPTGGLVADWWDSYMDLRFPDGDTVLRTIDDKQITIPGTMSLQDRFTAVAEAFSSNTSFVVEVKENMFNLGVWIGQHLPENAKRGPLPNLLGLHQETPCNHVRYSPSRIVQNLVTSFKEKLNLTNFATLHIRRQDASWQCDTSVPRVLRYADCWFSDGQSNAKTLVLFTDETDQVYLQDLLQQLSAASERWGAMLVHHGDPILASLAPGAQNSAQNGSQKDGYDGYDGYATYSAARELMKESTAQLELRRFTSCPPPGKCMDA
ncbi:unnamed protein product [Effrenium voratum]|nr:unnamed protein product [Effrenium voratum]